MIFKKIMKQMKHSSFFLSSGICRSRARGVSRPRNCNVSHVAFLLQTLSAPWTYALYAPLLRAYLAVRSPETCQRIVVIRAGEPYDRSFPQERHDLHIRPTVNSDFRADAVFLFISFFSFSFFHS